MVILRRSFIALLLICMGCSAQSASPALVQRIQRQVRAYYNVPVGVDITVGPLKPSEFAGYDAVNIVMEGANKKVDYDFLVAKDGKQLIRLTKLDLTKDPYAEVMKKIDLAGRPTRGNKDAKVVIVNFDDFECPYCSSMHQTLFPGIFKEYGDRVLFVYKDYPLREIHPWAVRAAVDANCLAAQSGDAYWDFADYIHGHQREVSSEKDRAAAVDRLTMQQSQQHHLDADKLQVCMKAQNEENIKKSEHEGESVGVSATPTMFVNGQELDGAVPSGQIRSVLDAALRQAGVAPPIHAPESSSAPAANISPANSQPSGK